MLYTKYMRVLGTTKLSNLILWLDFVLVHIFDYYYIFALKRKSISLFSKLSICY